MAPLDYEILSKLMSYAFTFLGAMIVWRTFSWLRKDRRITHKRLKALPDAGTIGILTVLQGSSELPEGTSLPVPYEGVLGFVRTCDVVVPVDSVIAQHLDFTFRNGKGLFIYPRRGCPVTVDGVTLDSPSDSRRYPMQHGSILCVGDAVLQLGVFAGLDVEHFYGVWQPQQPEPFPYEAPDSPYQPYTAYPTAMNPYGRPDAYPPVPPQPVEDPEGRPEDEA